MYVAQRPWPRPGRRAVGLCGIAAQSPLFFVRSTFFHSAQSESNSQTSVGISSLEASRLRPMHRGAEASHGETAPLCAGRPLSRGEDAVPDGCIDPSTVDRFTECVHIRDNTQPTGRRVPPPPQPPAPRTAAQLLPRWRPPRACLPASPAAAAAATAADARHLPAHHPFLYAVPFAHMASFPL
jgi:hypothetical protein